MAKKKKLIKFKGKTYRRGAFGTYEVKGRPKKRTLKKSRAISKKIRRKRKGASAK